MKWEVTGDDDGMILIMILDIDDDIDDDAGDRAEVSYSHNIPVAKS